MSLSPTATTADLDKQRKLIATAYDPAIVCEAGQRLMALFEEHMTVVQSGTGPVLNWVEPQQNIKLARTRLENSSPPDDIGTLLEGFDESVRLALERGQNLHHPHYVGHQVPASLPLAALLDAAGTLTNQVMAIYEMGPWATAVERAVVEQLGEAIGFASGTFGGLVTSGGSLANLTALLTARNVCLGESWEQGLSGKKPAPVLVAHADSHYSVTRSAGILGLGTDQVVPVPLDGQRRMDVDQLERILDELGRREVPIVAVCAAACATPIGAFDQLEAISDVCQRHQVWLHVDAAHGGAACMSAKHRHLVAGLQRADSVVCDAHKMLFMPALCALVFYRDQSHRFAAFHQEAPYLFDPLARELAEYDSGLANLECTKRAAALGLWGIWSIFGSQLFEALVDSTFDLGQQFFQLLETEDDFQPYARPQCNIVAFRYLPAKLQEMPSQQISDFQLRLRQAVVRSGEFYLVSSSIDGENYLRTTLINPLTTIEHLRDLLGSLRQHARRLLEES